MDLVQEHPDFDYVLRGADGTSALVNERKLERSFIITPMQLVEGWPVAELALLDTAVTQTLLALGPEVVIIGTGLRQGFPAAEVMAACLQRGIGVECMANAAAARTFNVLAGEGRRVVAGFILGG